MAEKPLALGEECIPPEEEAQIEKLVQFGKSAMECKPHPPMFRDQHPKSHGCVQGQFIVEANIPDEMKVGVFKEPKTYEAWIRFSNSTTPDPQGKLQSDRVGDGRGMAIKLMKVEGEKVLDDPNHQDEQDFVLLNSPTFFIPDVRVYLAFFINKAIKEGIITPKPEEATALPEDIKVKLQGVKGFFETLQGKTTNSPLEITYWSSTPYKLGDRAMKFSAVPNFTGKSFDRETATDKDNYLREAMKQQLANQDAVFDFKIQLQKDAVKMPIEDSTIEWDEKESPFIKVATIRIPKQEFDTPYRNEFDEKQAFSPWNTLPELRPLGGVNRARKRIYQELAQFRKEANQSK